MAFQILFVLALIGGEDLELHSIQCLRHNKFNKIIPALIECWLVPEPSGLEDLLDYGVWLICFAKWLLWTEGIVTFEPGLQQNL